MKTTDSDRLYRFALLGSALAGLLLIWWASDHRGHVGDRESEAVLSAVQRQLPALTAATADSIRGSLHFWQEKLVHEGVWEVVWRDVGIALLIAVVLGLSIEWYARRRLQDEITSGIVEAAYERLIPEAIFTQVHQHLLGAKVVREGWAIHMGVRHDPTACGNVPGLYLSRTVMQFSLRNVAPSGTVRHPVVLKLDRDVRSPSNCPQLPQFVSVKIGNEEFKGDALKQQLKDDGCSFQHTADLLPDAAVRVIVEIDEIVRVPDTFVWNTSLCTKEGAQVTIDSAGAPGVEFHVTALHPEDDALKERVHGHWEMTAAFLPYQGFQIWSQESAETKLLSSGQSSKQINS